MFIEIHRVQFRARLHHAGAACLFTALALGITPDLRADSSDASGNQLVAEFSGATLLNGQDGNFNTLEATVGEPLPLQGADGNGNQLESGGLLSTLLPLTEGEGTPGGEGAPGGEGTVDGEGVVDGEGTAEGEGAASSLYDQLLIGFVVLDTNGDEHLSLEEITAQIPAFSQNELAAADANADALLSVAEVLQFNGPGILHRADINGDFLISLSEVLRLVQLYNAGGYACAGNAGLTEDGYEPRPPQDGDPLCLLHAIDGNDDNVISLSELLRGIQLYNFAGYEYCQTGEDTFCKRP